MERTIIVGIADIKVARGGDILVTHALGSCVGICLYDNIVHVAGLAHIMLPSSTQFENRNLQQFKFADTAIACLLRKMEELGANRRLIKAKIAGGAQMFETTNGSSLANIGARNVEAVKAELRQLGIAILAEDTGKNYGRTQYLYSADGTMRITSVNRGEWVY